MKERRTTEAPRERSGYLSSSARPSAANDGGGVVVVSPAELRALVQEAVGVALEGATDHYGGRLLNRDGLSERLACSAGHVDTLRRRGMPCIYVGDSPRFVFDDCVRWLEAQQKEPA